MIIAYIDDVKCFLRTLIIRRLAALMRDEIAEKSHFPLGKRIFGERSSSLLIPFQ